MSMDPQQRQSGGTSWFAILGFGCLGVIAVSVLVCGAGYWFLMPRIKGAFADFGRAGFVYIVENSNLKDEEESQMIADIDRFADAFKEGTVGSKQFGQFFTGLGKTRLLEIMMVQSVEKKFLEDSGLDEQEQAEGRQTIYRLANLIHDDGVSSGKLQEVLKQISTSDPDAKEATILKERVTDEELRAFLLDAKKLADDQEVAPDAPRINVAVDFTRIVDKAIAQPQP